MYFTYLWIRSSVESSGLLQDFELVMSHASLLRISKLDL